MKNSSCLIVFLYGLILIIMGFFGFAAGSRASLSGVVFGLLVVGSAFFMYRGVKWGIYASLGLTIALMTLFCVRYALTLKTVPAILATLSAFMLLYLLPKAVKWKK